MALPQTPPKFTTVITGSKEYSIEINDANFETQAWKLPRYEGCQLFTTKLNKVSSTTISGSGSVAGKHYVGPIIGGGTGSITVPDKTGYGKTACVQKYTRNIYVGNAVVGMDNGGENDKLLNFPEFSYVTTNVYYTINDDGTITTNRLESKKDNFDERNGFYRAFYEDFPIGSDCKIVINDGSIKTNLKDSYNIFFNGGQLKTLFHLDPMEDSGNLRSLIYSSGSLNDDQIQTVRIYIGAFDTNKGLLNFGFAADNLPLLQTFYTRSLKGPGDSVLETGNSDREIVDNTFNDVFDAFFEFKANSSYVNDKRLFISFISGSTGTGKNNNTTITPLVLNKEENHGGNKGAIRNDLSFVSTCEIDSVTFNDVASNSVHDEYIFNVSPKNNLSQDYQNLQNHTPLGASSGQTVFGTGGISPQDPLVNRIAGYISGSIQFTLTDDSNPSLLLNLPKNNHLQDGIGQKGFVIIPENIHPHVKKNLTYFLAKAGVPLGIDVVPALDNEFKKLR